MSKISIPVVITENFDREATWGELKRANADRVFLALSLGLPSDPEKRKKLAAEIRTHVQFYKEKQLEVGIWFWTFWRDAADAGYQHMRLQRTADGTAQIDTYFNSSFICPTCEDFVTDSLDFIRLMAETGADILMFDDDYRLSGQGVPGIGCYCDGHMALTAKKLGETLTPADLRARIYTGGANKYRTAWQEATGENLEDYARKVRAVVDTVNPAIRVALCAVMYLWDTDGATDPIRISKILAGGTKPLLRLIGAPYWAVAASWGNRLQHVIELERMQIAWCADTDIELMTEGDLYPRPRYMTPANYAEGFDTALRFSGNADGILKYMIDYHASPTYETGYIDRHLKNQPIYDAIPALTKGLSATGVRVYERTNKILDADMTDIEQPENYAGLMFHSRAARLLSDHTIPTTYDGTGYAGIAFGENARHLPPEALQNGLILDLRAARILMEQGIDVGIEHIGTPIRTDRLHYLDEDDYTRSYYGFHPRSAFRVTAKPQAKVLITISDQDVDYADAFRYENADGQRFLVFAFDSYFTHEKRYRSYCMQRLLIQSIEWLCQKALPLRCTGHPDLYTICKTDDMQRAVGLWNFFADEVMHPTIELNESYDELECLHCTGTLNGNTVTLSDIPPYGFAFFKVKKHKTSDL